jgi:ABC-type nitrate/sulfonate/bicarbonate transport system substrate-binding protein
MLEAGTVRLRCALVSFALVVSADAHAGEKVRILLPDRHNLQYMSFWVAKSAGLFEKVGVDVDLVLPPAPQQAASFFERREADVAVLAPPMYVALIAKRVPVVLVANLLSNDPIDLVVRRSVAAERHLTPELPLGARLSGLRGLRIGIAPHPPTRLRALFATQGLDADKDTTMVTLHGMQQNAAFHAGEVDALYAHTPFLERAIVHDDAVVLVDQSRGDVPVLANRVIHVLVVNRILLETRHELVRGLVRAITGAEAFIHRSNAETVLALRREMPDRDPRELETIVRLYEPAIPKSPEVRADDILGSLTMFPADMPIPDLKGIDLTQHVAHFANAPERSGTWTVWRWCLVLLAAVVTCFVLVRRRRQRDLDTDSRC